MPKTFNLTLNDDGSVSQIIQVTPQPDINTAITLDGLQAIISDAQKTIDNATEVLTIIQAAQAKINETSNDQTNQDSPAIDTSSYSSDNNSVQTEPTNTTPTDTATETSEPANTGKPAEPAV